MIKLKVKELLEQNGKTKYWLYKQLGMSYQNFNKMINNETKSIRYENIETICLLLNCTPNDIFEITEDWCFNTSSYSNRNFNKNYSK